MLCARLRPRLRLAVWVFLVVPFGEAGKAVAVDLVAGGGGDDAVGDSTQGGGPAPIRQHGTFSHDGAGAKSTRRSPCSVSTAPVASLRTAGLAPPRMMVADSCRSSALSATATSGWLSS